MGIYVIVIQGEVATVAEMDDATLAEVRAQVDGDPQVLGNVIGPVTITTNPIQIETEVEQALDLWRL